MKGLLKAAVLVLVVLFAASFAIAAEEKRPVQPDDVLKKARDNYGKESVDMLDGKGGTTYGIKGYDYLTGVGKRSKGATIEKLGERLCKGNRQDRDVGQEEDSW